MLMEPGFQSKLLEELSIVAQRYDQSTRVTHEPDYIFLGKQLLRIFFADSNVQVYLYPDSFAIRDPKTDLWDQYERYAYESEKEIALVALIEVEKELDWRTYKPANSG